MAFSRPQFVAACSFPPLHNIKPGRRRGGLRSITVLFCMTLLLAIGQAQAVALHRGNIDQILKAIVVRQDPLSNGAAPSTAPPIRLSHTVTSVTDRLKSTATAVTTSTDSSSSSSSNATVTQSSAQPTLTALPKAFDGIIGNNFTNDACPKFLMGLGSNPSFNNCLPFSIIIQQSSAFFEDQAQPALLQDILDATCNVNLDGCQSLMAGLANKLRSNDYCGNDYTMQNPVVIDAYNGFLSYTPMYQAGCLKTSAQASSDSSDSSSPSVSEYCYGTTTVPGSGDLNNYIYSLPLGSPLPESGTLNCTTCLQQTMGFFANAATNATSPMATLYAGAATEINSKCGPSWVKPNITVDKSTEQSGAVTQQSQLGLAALMAVVVGWAMV